MRIELLDLDGAQARQEAVREQAKVTHDLQEWGPKIRMGCSFWRYNRFAAELPVSSSPRLTLFGSGDFHHVTLALLKQIKTPFHLAIIDKHPDWVKYMPIMHCGTWLAHALKLPNLRNVYHFGGDLDFDNSYRHLAPWSALRSGRIKVFPSHRSYTTGDWPKIDHPPLRRDPKILATHEELRALLKPVAKELAEFPLYVSVDKDAVRLREAIVNWDSGKLHLREVEFLIRAIFEANRKPAVGADILGDWSRVRMKGAMREMLDWSEHPTLDVNPVEAAEVNAAGNERLIDAFRAGFQ